VTVNPGENNNAEIIMQNAEIEESGEEFVGDGVLDASETEIVDLEDYAEEEIEEETETDEVIADGEEISEGDEIGEGIEIDTDIEDEIEEESESETEPESEETITVDDNILTVITITKKGFGKRCEFERFTRRNRGGKGMACHRISEKTGELVGALSVLESDDIMIITDGGTMIRTPVSGIPVYNNRAAGGVKVMRTSDGVSIKSVIRVAAAEIEDDEDEDVDGESGDIDVVEDGGTI
jgi:DNA gyrase/topoisomerase IV subunit A